MICEFVNAFANIKARPAGAAALGGTPTLYRPYVKTPRLDAARAVPKGVRSHVASHTHRTLTLTLALVSPSNHARKKAERRVSAPPLRLRLVSHTCSWLGARARLAPPPRTLS